MQSGAGALAEADSALMCSQYQDLTTLEMFKLVDGGEDALKIELEGNTMTAWVEANGYSHKVAITLISHDCHRLIVPVNRFPFLSSPFTPPLPHVLW